MIKKILKKVVVFFLQAEAKLILRKYKPKIVAVTGTVGKTSAKEAINLVLEKKFHCCKSEKSYNSELGVPLTIIGAKSAWNNIVEWVLVFIKGLKVILEKNRYSEWLVLEMGVGKPKDMEHLVSWARPDIAVVTAFAETPVHVERFKEPEELFREKAKLVSGLKEGGFAVLNGDDHAVMEVRQLAEKKNAKTITFGFSEGNDLVASNYRLSADGISFKVDYKGSIFPVRMPYVFGKQYVYTALAGLGTAVCLGLNLIETSETLSRFKPPPGRLNLLDGIKNSLILDDTYNSSPIACAVAIETLKELPGERKIAVLGDMLELGKFAVEEHKKIGRLVKGVGIDLLFVVGPRAKFISQEARENGFAPENIFEFSSSEEAKMSLQEKIKEGDLILVKGSQAMRMERIVEEVMAHPEFKNQFLVRQEKEWLNKG